VDGKDLLPIGEVAARSGFSTSALRFYEKEGCSRRPGPAGGQRRYPRSVLRRLAFVRAGVQRRAEPGRGAAALATLPAGRTPSKTDWRRLSESWRARLDEQITALEDLRDGLSSCIGCGCLSLRSCRCPTPMTPRVRRAPARATSHRRCAGPPAERRAETAYACSARRQAAKAAEPVRTKVSGSIATTPRQVTA
jgi:MerR family redox-sensitive transcriptional activator SoxR